MRFYDFTKCSIRIRNSCILKQLEHDFFSYFVYYFYTIGDKNKLIWDYLYDIVIILRITIHAVTEWFVEFYKIAYEIAVFSTPTELASFTCTYLYIV